MNNKLDVYNNEYNGAICIMQIPILKKENKE